jgi:prevent-host-death family protein
MKTVSAKKPTRVVRGSYKDTPSRRRVSQEIDEILERVTSDGERVILRRRGKKVAAVVPIEDLKLLEELEDRQDVELAQAALEEMKRTGEKPIPWSKVKAKLGL